MNENHFSDEDAPIASMEKDLREVILSDKSLAVFHHLLPSKCQPSLLLTIIQKGNV